MLTKQQVLKILLSKYDKELGVQETRDENGHWDNSGPRVLQYQHSTTLGGTGWPWCMALNTFCIKETEADLSIDIPWPNLASCTLTLNWADEQECVHENPEVGDVFLVMASETKATHTGNVRSVNGDNFGTIEGNTNSSGGREGYKVMKHERENSSRYKFVRFLDLFEFSEIIKSDNPQWPKATISIGGKREIEGEKRGSVVWTKARDMGDALGLTTGWSSEHQAVLWNGRDVPTEADIKQGSAWIPVKAGAQFCGLQTKWVGGDNNLVNVYRTGTI